MEADLAAQEEGYEPFSDRWYGALFTAYDMLAGERAREEENRRDSEDCGYNA